MSDYTWGNDDQFGDDRPIIEGQVRNPIRIQLLTILLYPLISSVIFCLLLEWKRYKVIGGIAAQNLDLIENIILFLLIISKTLVFFAPFVLVCAILILFKKFRLVKYFVNLIWVTIFYLMAFDLFSVSFAGYHLWDYMPNIRDIFENPGQNIWQWAGERLTTEAATVLVFFIILGPIFYLAVRHCALWMTDRFTWFSSKSAIIALAAVYIALIPAMLPGLGHLPERICSALPFHPSVIEPLKSVFQSLDDRMEIVADAVSTGVDIGPKIVSGVSRYDKRLALLRNSNNPEPVLGDILLDDTPGGESSHFTHSRDLIDFGGKIARTYKLFRPEARLFNLGGLSELKLEDSGDGMFDVKLNRNSAVSVDFSMISDGEMAATSILRESLNPGGHDPDAFVVRKDLPNIVMIIFESFRHSALSQGLMKELDEWANQGLRLQRHYSGSNCSHLGFFSLLYGRNPLGYHQTLDRHIPAQMLESLRNSGYEITFLTSGETRGFRRLDQFINRNSCDNYIEDGEFCLKAMSDWPESDRKKLARVQKILTSENSKPQFVFFYLVSSHYRYPFPPEFEIYKEHPSLAEFLDPSSQIQNHLNRYSNAILFLESEVMKMLRSIDPQKNLVLITGDHGESMGEDGVFTHGSRMSEIQMRVPMVMVGPGVEPRRISTATTHADVLPTLLHVLAGKEIRIRNSGGRDLIADPAPLDEVTLVPANGPNWDGVMMIQGDKRMLFRSAKSASQAPVMRFLGLADQTGAIDQSYSRKWRVVTTGNR